MNQAQGEPASSLPVALLRLLDEGGLHSTAELARRLAVSDGMFAALTADLVRRGYLAAVASGDGCNSCALAGGCGVSCATPAPLLALTEKGRRAARAGRPDKVAG